jgi:hypothetical protein
VSGGDAGGGDVEGEPGDDRGGGEQVAHGDLRCRDGSDVLSRTVQTNRPSATVWGPVVRANWNRTTFTKRRSC